MLTADRAGLAVFGLVVGWTAAIGVADDHDAAPRLASLLGAGAVYALGRRTCSRGRSRVAMPLALAGTVLAASLLIPDALSGSPTAPPTGYGNANGALLALATGAAAMAACAARSAELRRRCVALAAVAGPVCVLTRSVAASIVCGLILLASALALRGGGRWLLQLSVVLSFVATVTVLTAAAFPRWTAVAQLERVLPIRPRLWAQALELVRVEPLRGQGPGAFADLSPFARDLDLRWPHSLLLEEAVEAGLVGAGLLVLLLVWAVGRLGRRATTDPYALVCGVLLCGLLTQASIDYTANFPVVTLGLAFLVGAGHSEEALRERQTPNV